MGPSAEQTENLNNLLLQAKLTVVSLIFSSPRSVVLEVGDSQNKTLVLKVRPSVDRWIQHESRILSGLSHPNLVKRMGFMSNQHFSGLLLERAKGVALIDLLRSGGSVSNAEIYQISAQLLSVLTFLETNHFVHLDLKPDNLIYDPDTGHLTLLDCENVYKCSKGTKFSEIVGTPEYSAPEVAFGNYEGRPAQVWSLGVTVFVLAVGMYPTFELDHAMEKSDQKRSKKSWLFPLLRGRTRTKNHGDNNRPENSDGVVQKGAEAQADNDAPADDMSGSPQMVVVIPEQVCPELRAILKGMLVMDAKKRLTLSLITSALNQQVKNTMAERSTFSRRRCTENLRIERDGDRMLVST